MRQRSWPKLKLSITLRSPECQKNCFQGIRFLDMKNISDAHSTLSADVLRMASRFPRRLFLTISSCSHHAILRTRSRGKIIIEQCEQGRNIAALQRIIKAPNNFGG